MGPQPAEKLFQITPFMNGDSQGWSGITISTSLPCSRGRWVTSLLTTCRNPGYTNSNITASVQTHARSRYWEFNGISKLCHQEVSHGVTRSGPGQRKAEQWKQRPNTCKAGDAAWPLGHCPLCPLPCDGFFLSSNSFPCLSFVLWSRHLLSSLLLLFIAISSQLKPSLLHSG